MGVIAVMLWLIGVIHLLAKSLDPPSRFTDGLGNRLMKAYNRLS